MWLTVVVLCYYRQANDQDRALKRKARFGTITVSSDSASIAVRNALSLHVQYFVCMLCVI